MSLSQTFLALSPASYSYCPTSFESDHVVKCGLVECMMIRVRFQLSNECNLRHFIAANISHQWEGWIFFFLLLLQIHQSSTVAVLLIVGPTWWLLCATGLFAQITIWDILISRSCSGDGNSESSMIMIHNHPSEDLICFGWNMMGGWLPTLFAWGKAWI